MHFWEAQRHVTSARAHQSTVSAQDYERVRCDSWKKIYRNDREREIEEEGKKVNALRDGLIPDSGVRYGIAIQNDTLRHACTYGKVQSLRDDNLISHPLYA